MQDLLLRFMCVQYIFILIKYSLNGTYGTFSLCIPNIGKSWFAKTTDKVWCVTVYAYRYDLTKDIPHILPFIQHNK